MKEARGDIMRLAERVCVCDGRGGKSLLLVTLMFRPYLREQMTDNGSNKSIT